VGSSAGTKKKDSELLVVKVNLKRLTPLVGGLAQRP
jgi:hypothetical protein